MQEWLEWLFYKRVYINDKKNTQTNREKLLSLISQREMLIKLTLCILKHSPERLKWQK